MDLKRKPPIFRRWSHFYLLLIAASPILLSLLIHLMFLFYASLISWQWNSGDMTAEEGTITATVAHEGKKDDGLKFQGTDPLDSFNADDNLYDPVPEIEYKPVVPDVEILPSPRASDDLSIISIDAAALDSNWVNPSTGGQPRYTGPEMMVGSFSRHIQVLREGGLDVVFVFDSTASMSGYLNEVKVKITHLAAAFRRLVPACRIGLVTYRDKPDEYVTKDFPLTYGVVNVQEFLNQIHYGGGYDVREAVTEGLEVAIEKMKWNKKSKKFILLIGDAPPHLEDMPRAVSLVKKFHEKMGGKLCALDIRQPKKITKHYWSTIILPNMKDPGIESFEYLTDNERVMDDFQTLVEAGGGECARLTNEEKVIKNMLLLVFGTRWEMYLNEFMKNL